jgi:hypothetical protein
MLLKRGNDPGQVCRVTKVREKLFDNFRSGKLLVG